MKEIKFDPSPEAYWKSVEERAKKVKLHNDKPAEPDDLWKAVNKAIEPERCKHGIVIAERYCYDCHKQRIENEIEKDLSVPEHDEREELIQDLTERHIFPWLRFLSDFPFDKKATELTMRRIAESIADELAAGWKRK